MCGRFSLFLPLKVIQERFGVKGAGARPSYNIAPKQFASAILNDTPAELSALQWGLVPFWAESPNTGYNMINARVESLAEKPSFKKILKEKRCLIPADGFYEWKEEIDCKQPYRIEHKQGLFAFAGLWDEWKDEEGDSLRTFTIITVPAGKKMSEIHDREPVMLLPEQKDAWLKEGDLGLLKPLKDDQLISFPVSSLVNSPKNNSPEIIEPVKVGAQKKLF